jgi:hypothetical protein
MARACGAAIQTQACDLLRYNFDLSSEFGGLEPEPIGS